MATSTVIRNAAWIIAWDANTGRHVYRRDGDVAFSGDRIVQAGGHYGGPADTTLDGRELMVMPGLVNIHSHPAGQPHFKGVREELSNPHFHGSGLYDMIALLKPPQEGLRHGAVYSLCELMLSGVTTIVDISNPYEGWQPMMRLDVRRISCRRWPCRLLETYRRPGWNLGGLGLALRCSGN